VGKHEDKKEKDGQLPKDYPIPPPSDEENGKHGESDK